MADEDDKESNEALKELQALKLDPYEALDLNLDASESDVRRAYRKTALKYHPDKNAGNDSAIAKFHALSLAYAVLSNATTRAKVDIARTAKREKAEREAAYDVRRQRMKDDLERRESGAFKRKHAEVEEEEREARELRRLQEEGQRMRQEHDERLRKEFEVSAKADKVTPPVDGQQDTEERARYGNGVSEMDRTIKVRFPREGEGQTIYKDELHRIFAKYGKIEHVMVSKDKKRRLDGQEDKTTVGSGFIVFSSVVGAHAAIEEMKGTNDESHKVFDQVTWASGQEPEFLKTMSGSPAASTPSTPGTASRTRLRQDLPGMGESPSTPLPKTAGNGLRKAPSFASFASASMNTPKASTPGNVNSPTLEELTMIRLRNAEKRRLEEQIRRREATEAEAEAEAA